MIPVARITKKFGAEGEVMLSLYPDFPVEFFPEFDALLAEVDGLPVPLYCDRFERRGRTGALVQFSDLASERRVEEFLGKELFMELGDQERDEDEFYLEDLIGFEVSCSDLRGRISDFYDNEANPLFELELEERTVLVPAVEEFIAGIDFDARKIKMVLPEGLLDL